MDGFELMRNLNLHDKYKTIPVIMISSRTAEKHREVAKSLGVRGFLGKPFVDAELLNMMESVLSQKTFGGV